MSMPSKGTLSLTVVQLVTSEDIVTYGGFLGLESYNSYSYVVGSDSGNTGSGTNTLSSSVAVTFGSGNKITFTYANGTVQSFVYSTIDTVSSNSGIVLVHQSGTLNWWILANPDADLSVGDTIVHNADGNNYAGDSTTWTYTSDGSGSSFTFAPSNGANVALCFLAGSLIRTTSGEKRIEEINEGDEIITFDHGHPVSDLVTWVGCAQHIVQSELSDDLAGYPVRVVQGAIADNVPYEDLVVTPEHCLYIDGQFISVRMLVNGISIYYDRSFSIYKYYHIETENHAIIMANGLLTESYLDTGNRSVFRSNDAIIRGLFNQPKCWDRDAAAPLNVSRSFVEPVHIRLAERAAIKGLTTITEAPQLVHDPALALHTQTGMVLSPVRKTRETFVFHLPQDAGDVFITSRTARPCDTLGAFVDDRRELGVLVGEIMLFDADGTKNIITHLDQEMEGWNNIEASSCRWTTGAGRITLGPRQNPSVLAVTVLASGPYLAAKDGMSISACAA